VNLSARIERLTPAQRAVLQQHLQRQRERSAHRERIPIRPQQHAAPPSFSQERLWFLEQLHAGSIVYNMPAVMPLRRPIRLNDANRALTRLAERHEILRTTFPKVDGRPVQLIAQGAQVHAQAVDLGELPASQRGQALAAAVAAVIDPPFDLEAAPPWRASLIEWSASRQYLVLCLHHIIADGWALDILLRELSNICDSIVDGVPDGLPPLPIQFADFAHWQRRHINDESLAESVGYWRTKLANMPALLELPTDHARPAVQSFHGAVLSFRLSPDLSAAVERLARETEAVPFMVLLAAFDVLLMRLSGAEDIVIGTPVANRTRSETEGLIGLFMNMVVLRTSLAGQPNFRELLARVRKDCIEAYAHQDVPFERLVEIVSPVRSLAYSPLFQVMFTLQAPGAAGFHPDLSADDASARRGHEDDPMANLDLHLSTSRVDLTVGLVRRHDGFQGSVEFSTDLFERGTIERMVDTFNSILQAVVDDPERRITHLPMINARLLATWNATDVPYPVGTLPGFIAAQAARTPSATAVVFGADRLTFAELESRAERLSRRLRGAGVARGAVVAICLPRCAELMVALLGTLKAGAAYLPVDPDTPPQRLRFMVEDASPAAVIAVPSSLALSEPLRTVPTVIDVLPPLGETAHGGGSAADCDGPAPDDLAYVIFTSGSTGRPKGVMITHRAVCNRLQWMIEEFGFGPADRIAQKTPITFDVSVWELFAPLMCGSCLVLMEPGAHRDPNEIVGFIRANGITVLHFVPSMLRAFLLVRDVEACRSLRQVVCSGEALPVDLVRAFFARSDAALANLYGPTEAAVDITFWHCPRASTESSVPIGRPVANCQTHILDHCMQPVAVGVTGELYLGGVQIAAGYIGRPELTAERFIPDLFSAGPQARLYRTGDLARYRPDGVIEYLGRSDFQVKIRGFRIELAEIEAVLREHQAVHEAAAVLRDDVEPQIAAFVVPRRHRPAADELRAFMARFLPEYAIPVSITFLDTLPLTTSGKLDRRALPRPEPVAVGRASAEPATSIEMLLSDMWREILHLERVGVEDDFFALGGHSLLAAQLLARIVVRFGVQLPLRRLFEAPTIAQLARALDQGMVATESALGPEALTPERARQLLDQLDELTPHDVERWLARLLAEDEARRPPPAPAVTPRLARDLLERLDALPDAEVDATLASLLATVDEEDWANLAALAVGGARLSPMPPDPSPAATRNASSVVALTARRNGDIAAPFLGAFANLAFSVALIPPTGAVKDAVRAGGAAAVTPSAGLATAWAAFVGEYRQAWSLADPAMLDPQTVALAGHHLVAAAQLLAFCELLAPARDVR
jgi:amino acid adenylation domain-containing protein